MIRRAEIALPTGTPIASWKISSDTTGFAELLAWIVDHAPDRVVVSIEGTRSYGIGLARPAGVPGDVAPLGSAAMMRILALNI